MLLIIAGSRDFNDYHLFSSRLDHLLSQVKDDQNQKNRIEIVSGCAKGADSLAIRYASERGYAFKRMPAQWDTYGKRAGMMRNKLMLDVLKQTQAKDPTRKTGLVLFWNGVSPGSKNMLEIAKQAEIPIRVVKY